MAADVKMALPSGDWTPDVIKPRNQRSDSETNDCVKREDMNAAATVPVLEIKQEGNCIIRRNCEESEVTQNPITSCNCLITACDPKSIAATYPNPTAGVDCDNENCSIHVISFGFTSYIRELEDNGIERSTRDAEKCVENQSCQASRKGKVIFAILAAMNFMGCAAVSILGPFFPNEASQKGMSSTVQGFVFGSYGFIVFLTSPVLGKLLPITGVKFMAVSGMLYCGTCNILFGLLQWVPEGITFTASAFGIRCLEAIGAACLITSSYTFIANTFSENITVYVGLFETFVGLGYCLGPAIGGFLYYLGGFSLPFFVLGGSLNVGCLLCLWILPSVTECKDDDNTGSISRLLRYPEILLMCLVTVTVCAVFGFLELTLEPHMRDEFGTSPPQVSLLFLVQGALYAILSVVSGWLTDRTNKHYLVMCVGLTLTGVGLLFMGPSPLLPFLSSSLVNNIVGFVIQGVFIGAALVPTLPTMLAACGSKEERGLGTDSVVAGLSSSMASLGQVLGPVIAGIMLEKYGYPILSTTVAFLNFVSAILLVLFKCAQKLTRPETTHGCGRSLETNKFSSAGNDQPIPDVPSAEPTPNVLSAELTPNVPSAELTSDVPSAELTSGVPSAELTSGVPSAELTSVVPSAEATYKFPSDTKCLIHDCSDSDSGLQ